MKELYEEVIEVKFYHDPFKGYADNYILGSEEVFVDKAEYKEENIVCNSFSHSETSLSYSNLFIYFNHFSTFYIIIFDYINYFITNCINAY